MVIGQNCSDFYIFNTPASASTYLFPACNLIINQLLCYP